MRLAQDVEIEAARSILPIAVAGTFRRVLPDPLLPGPLSFQREHVAYACGKYSLSNSNALLQPPSCSSRDVTDSKTLCWKVRTVFPFCSTKVILTSVSCLGFLPASS